MASLRLQIDPARLTNPDLDIRYVLPALITEQSGGAIQDDGYDYAEDGQTLLLFLTAENAADAVACITRVIAEVPVLGNNLSGAVRVMVKHES